MALPIGSVSYWLRRKLGISEIRREKLVLAGKRINEIWNAVIHNRMGGLGVAILVFFVAIAFLAPIISPWDPLLTVDEKNVPLMQEAPIDRNEPFNRWDPLPPVNVTLYANASRGWGLSNATMSEPGPSITVFTGTLVRVTLVANDTAPHLWFLDYNGNNTLLNDTDYEPHSPELNISAPVVTFAFTARKPGNWTYLCNYTTSMTGLLHVLHQNWTGAAPNAQKFDDSVGAVSGEPGQWLNTSLYQMRLYRDVIDSVGFVALISRSGTDPGQYLGVRVSYDDGATWSSKYEVRQSGRLFAVDLTHITTWNASKLDHLVLNVTHEADPGTSGSISLDYIGATTVWRSYWHLFGTDQDGRDILSRVIWGSRISLLVGFLASVIAGVLGTLVGLASGFWAGWRDELLMRVNDILLSLPWLALLIVLAAILGGTLNLTVIIIVIGLTSWSFTARVVRAQVLTVKERVFVERAKASGASNMSILRKHIFPNVFPLVFANTILTVAVSILSESTLAFLGKVDPTSLSWGVVLHEAEQSNAINTGQWAWIMMPGLALVIVILGFSLLGNALDEILNPKLRER